MNRDFVEILSELCAGGVEFLVVGAHALAAHGIARATGDLDIWIRPSPENARRAFAALARFGAPLSELTPSDLVNPDIVFQMGLPPARVDILSSISGVSFDDAWPHRITASVAGIEVPVLGKADFIANKRAAGRPKDLADVIWLEGETS